MIPPARMCVCVTDCLFACERACKRVCLLTCGCSSMSVSESHAPVFLCVYDTSAPFCEQE